MNRIKKVLIYLFLGVFTFYLFALLPLFIGMLDSSQTLTLAQTVGLEKSISTVVLFLFCLLVAFWLKDKELHFSSTNFSKTLAIGFLGFLAITVFVFFWERVTQDNSSIALIKGLGIGENFLDDLWLIVSIALFGPIAEELAFRLLIYNFLKNTIAQFFSLKFAIPIAVTISSWAFMAIHGADEQASQFLALFIVGVIFAVTYEFSGSIFAPIFAHSLNNALAFYQNINAAKITLFSSWLLLILALMPFFALILTLLMKKIHEKLL